MDVNYNYNIIIIVMFNTADKKWIKLVFVDDPDGCG